MQMATSRHRKAENVRRLFHPSPEAFAELTGLRWAGLYVTFGWPGRFVLRSRSAQAANPPFWAGSGCWACFVEVMGCRLR
jgi:hypothetical protein